MRKAMKWSKQRMRLRHYVVLFAAAIVGLGYVLNVGPQLAAEGDQLAAVNTLKIERATPVKPVDDVDDAVVLRKARKLRGAPPIEAASNKFNLQLTPAYDAYFKVTESLSRDDLANAQSGLKMLVKAFAKVDADTLTKQQQKRWGATLKAIVSSSQKASKSQNRATCRVHYQDVSKAVLSMLQGFGHSLEKPVHQAFCPMAFNNQGAAWLQADRKLANPYFGAEMLRCGSFVRLGEDSIPAEKILSEVDRQFERLTNIGGKLARSHERLREVDADMRDFAMQAISDLRTEQEDIRQSIEKKAAEGNARAQILIAAMFPSHNHHHGPNPNGTPQPHMDHSPHHRGVLVMHGNLHFETVVAETGRVAVHLSDAYRRPLRASVIENLEVILNPETAAEEHLKVSKHASGQYWEGQGKAINNAGATVQVAFDYEEEPYAIELDVAHPLRTAALADAASDGGYRAKGSKIPGSINMGMTGKKDGSGSYASGYLKEKMNKKLYGGNYQQSGSAHFGSEPGVDVPLMVAASTETVVIGARAPEGAPTRTYNVSAINAEITLNQYHDNFVGYMFVLTEDVEKVRAEETRNADARLEKTDPGAVTNGLSGDALQPLAIRVNQGERLIINLKNEVDDEVVSFHVHGSNLVVQKTGEAATSTNADAYVEAGTTQTFEWYVAPDQQEGVHHFHSHYRDQASQGMFGSLVVEPRGSRFLDPYTGEELQSGWLAMIEDPAGPDFREFVVVYHEVGDETFRPLAIDDTAIPLRDQAADTYRPSTRAINYRSESFANNLILQDKLHGVMDESMGYSSYTFGDPSTPIPRSYLGDPAKWRLVHGGSEVFHSHHLHGGAIRWRRQPKLTQDLALFGTNNMALATDGPIKFPPVRSTSDRVDVQTIGPAETHDLTIECCSGGCQFTAGDFLYHCHIPHHYVAGMWAFWRTYNTLQAGDVRTDVMPALAELPDRRGKMKPAVDSSKLVGRTMKWFGKEFRVVEKAGDNTPGVYSLADWVEAQLPPKGKPGKKDDEKGQVAAYDASVWDWDKDGDVYLGEPETGIDWPKYKPKKAGERPKLLFDLDTGKLAWPHMKPHFGKRPPFSPDHNPAPFLEPIRRNSDGSKSHEVAKPGENGPWSLSPLETSESQRKYFNIHAIMLPITLTKAEGDLPPIVDEAGQIYVLHEEEEAIRGNDDLKVPLVLRANVGDTVDVILTNEIPDFDENLYASKVNMHIHFVQFDTQASDGVITGMSYEQSVRPFTVLEDTQKKGFGRPQNEPLTADAVKGATKITVNNGDSYQVGVLIGIGLDQVGKVEIRRVTAIDGNVLTLDEALAHDHKAKEFTSVEFVRYRWYADSDFGITYWHDHAYGLTSWGHGLFGATVIEPKGSTYHDPVTGKEVRSGPVADIHTNQPVSSEVRSSFREYVLQIQDSNPRLENKIISGTVFEKPAEGQTKPEKISKIGSMDSWSLRDTAFKYLNGGERTSGSSFGLRAEPLNRRLHVNPDPSVLFSSTVHGDPDTPLLRSYLGDPIVIRALDHAGNEVHTINVNGHSFPLERYAPNSRQRSAFHLGIAERYDLVIPAAGGPQQMAGDYLYHSGRSSHLGEGMWGIMRVLDEKVADLQPLPGRETVPKSAESFYPADAIVKEFNVSAIDFAIDLNPLAPDVIDVEGTNRNIIAANPDGKVFVLDEEVDSVKAGKKAVHPLCLRANVGEVIKINLTNRLKAGRVSIHADMLAYDPKDSLGINVGNNPGDQTVAPGGSKTYTFYAHPDLGEAAALITDWGDITAGPRNGLYGAIVIGPRGSTYYDPATGEEITLKNNWRADVVVDATIPENSGRTSYRHASLFFQDEDNVIGTSFMPYVRDTAGLAAVNYRIEPLRWRAEKYELDEEKAFLTTGKNDPVTPIIEALPGDQVRIHVFGAHSEQNTTFSLEGHQWALEPKMEGTEMLEAEQFGGMETLEVNVTAGGPQGLPGDYVYQSHRLAYAEAGQWGIFRVLKVGGTGVGALDSHGPNKVVQADAPASRRESETVVQVADRSSGSFPWYAAMAIVGLSGLGALSVRSARRTARLAGVAGLFAAAILLTYAAANAAGADDAPAAKKQPVVVAQLKQLKPLGGTKPLPGTKPDTKPAGTGIKSLSGTGTVGAMTLEEKRKGILAKLMAPAEAPPEGAKPIEIRGLATLPPLEPPNPVAAELGMMLFFDNRISGDADITCSTCHNPEKGWTDGEALSTGYPGTRYFRSAPTVLNAAHAHYFYWDARLGGDDLATQSRDSINDSHFMSSDGRVMLERMKQIPAYVDLFEKAGFGEPSLTKITKAIAAFETLLIPRNVPFDRFLNGQADALSAEAKAGLTLFIGKAGCIKCHNGPYLADGKKHALGVPENPEVFSDPFRIITFRSQLKFVGTPNYLNLRNDPGNYSVTKNAKDFGKFRTPTLREVGNTAPYMHNGMLPTLEAVVDFYNNGGGDNVRNNKSDLVKPLELTAEEKASLVAFLKSLSGDPIVINFAQTELPEYGLIEGWYDKKN
ncbi:MAG: hypothetical protein CMJ48_12040 [Planctomycetaceae bacterium]|nr:hypothetical protein [Planctomycetaceae bacterium]